MVKGPDFVICPLIDEKIEAGDCLENSSAVDRILKADSVPERFKAKPDWEEICRKCKWHDY